MKIATTGLMALALFAGTAAIAQTAPKLNVGDTVFDPTGAEVGKIASVTPDAAIVDTGMHKVSIPSTSFGTGARGATLSATKAQVDNFGQQADDAAKAALAAALKPGANVMGANGATVGTVKTVEANLVEVSTPKGAVKLPTTAFATATGGVKIGMTAAEFDAAVTAATKPS